MNKFILLFFLAFVSYKAMSQNYQPFRATFGLGITNGVVFYFEPSLLLTDRFSIGYRTEGLLSFDYRIASKGAVFQYYFLPSETRVFAGLGFASYTHQASNYSSSDDTNFGFFPRFGYDIGHFTMCMDFNIITSDYQIVSNAPHMVQTTEMVNRSYISLRIGMMIGGGKKTLVNDGPQ